MKGAVRGIFGVVLLALGGCAAVPRDPAARAEFRANHDPFEPMNRHVFAFNQVMDRAVIRPVAEGYVHAVPRDLREVIRNFLDNLDQPLIFANCLLQARWRDAGRTAARFAVNTTVGVAGLGDPATEFKMPKETGDFGQTLARWGVHEGPYLMLPLFGPTTVRDGIGRGVDTYLDPWYYAPAHRQTPASANVARVAGAGIDGRAQNLDTLDVLKRESIDFYAALRSLYRQHRAAEISGQSAQAATPASLPPANFYDDPAK